MDELFNQQMNEFFSCWGEEVIEKRQKFNVFGHVQFERHHMAVQSTIEWQKLSNGQILSPSEKNVQPENALLWTTTPWRCTWTAVGRPNLPIIIVLHCTGITKKYAHIITYYLYVGGSGVRIEKIIFRWTKFRKFGFWTIKGIYPSRLLFYPSSSKLNKGNGDYYP